MDYHFNADIAVMYGVEEATFIHNLYWWIRKNRANAEKCYEDKTWTYNSMKAFTDLFPFWTEKQVRRIIKNLAEAGAIYIGNFNEDKRDRTQWYALSDEIFQIYGESCTLKWSDCNGPNGQMSSAQMGAPLPYSKPDSKPDEVIKLISGFGSELQQVLQIWLKYKREKRQAYTATGIEQLRKKVQQHVDQYGEGPVIAIINDTMACNYQGIVWDKIKPAQDGRRKLTL